MTLYPRPHPRPDAADSPTPGSAGPASRRAFLIGTGAVAGTAALGAGVLGAGAAQASAPSAADTKTGSLTAGEPVVAYISNVASGEITVMSGDREIAVHDHALARALARKVR